VKKPKYLQKRSPSDISSASTESFDGVATPTNGSESKVSFNIFESQKPEAVADAFPVLQSKGPSKE
jgi:hypothetical protein